LVETSAFPFSVRAGQFGGGDDIFPKVDIVVCKRRNLVMVRSGEGGGRRKESGGDKWAARKRRQEDRPGGKRARVEER
jgi:hypothetical protein